MRIAIKGNISEATKFVELIRNKPDCMVSGLFSEITAGLSEIDKLIDHPFPLYDNLFELLQASDAILFLDHCITDVPMVKQALKNSKHVFIQPEDLLSPHILNEYQNLAEEAGVLFYVFHNAIMGELENSIRSFKDYPEYIDISRNVYEKDGKIPNLRKLILKEILFLTTINPHAIKKFKTISVPYNSEKPYLVNLRIDFENYSSANLTINNFSAKDSRKTEVYFRHQMIFLNTEEDKFKVIHLESQEIESYPLPDLIYNESDPSMDIKHFLHKLTTYAYPVNSFESGITAYISSWEILDKIIPALLEK